MSDKIKPWKQRKPKNYGKSQDHRKRPDYNHHNDKRFISAPSDSGKSSNFDMDEYLDDDWSGR